MLGAHMMWNWRCCRSWCHWESSTCKPSVARKTCSLLEKHKKLINIRECPRRYFVHDGNSEVRLLRHGVALGAELALSQELLARNDDTLKAWKNLCSTESLVKFSRNLR